MLSRGDGSDMREWLPALEIRPGFGTIIEDLIDAGFQFGCPLLHHLQSLQGVLQLCNGSSSNEGRIEVIVLDGPCNCQMSQFAA